LGVSQRATATNILAYLKRQIVQTIIFQVTLALQTDNQGRRFLATDSFQKNASVSDVWQAQFTLRYTFGK
jgi:hypothetical protein